MSSNDPASNDPTPHDRPNFGAPAPAGAAAQPLPVWAVPFGIVAAVLTATGGGFLCGWAMMKLGTLGAVSLLILGEAVGYGVRQVMGGVHKVVAWSLAIGCLVAYFVAETTWIRYETNLGEDGWWAALQAWPIFLNERTLSAVIGFALAGFGAAAAYRRTAHRYRLVMVREERVE